MITAVQYKAIDWYAKTNNLKPCLSAIPFITFMGSDGMLTEEPISYLENAFKAHRKEVNREKARAKKVGSK